MRPDRFQLKADPFPEITRETIKGRVLMAQENVPKDDNDFMGHILVDSLLPAQKSEFIMIMLPQIPEEKKAFFKGIGNMLFEKNTHPVLLTITFPCWASYVDSIDKAKGIEPRLDPNHKHMAFVTVFDVKKTQIVCSTHAEFIDGILQSWTELAFAGDPKKGIIYSRFPKLIMQGYMSAASNKYPEIKKQMDDLKSSIN